MKVFAAVLFLCVAFASAEFADKSEDDFLAANAACAKKLSTPESHLAKFQEFEYPDDAITRDFLYCVWSDMGLWNDKTGYNVEHIAHLYKDKANTEVLIPILSECNKNAANEPAKVWMFRGFQCIMSSKIGEWFKDDMAKKAAAKA